MPPGPERTLLSAADFASIVHTATSAMTDGGPKMRKPAVAVDPTEVMAPAGKTFGPNPAAQDRAAAMLQAARARAAAASPKGGAGASSPKLSTRAPLVERAQAQAVKEMARRGGIRTCGEAAPEVGCHALRATAVAARERIFPAEDSAVPLAKPIKRTVAPFRPTGRGSTAGLRHVSDLNGGGDVALIANTVLEKHAVRELPLPQVTRLRSGFASGFATFG